jgi:hypothetical protein
MTNPQPDNFPAPERFARFSPTLKRALTKLPLLVCVGLFLFHFSVIRKYAVNLPNLDDWGMFAGDNHPASADLAWLYAQHSEHRTTTTKLFVWLQFQLNGWNVRTHLLVDFLLYGLFLILLVWFTRRVAPQLQTWVALSFIVFFLSPIIWIEHFMAYPVAVHFWLLFLLIAAWLLFGELQKWYALIGGCIAAVFSTYSFASGFVTSLILLIAFCLFKWLRASDAEVKDRRREFLQLLCVVGLIGGPLIIWIISFIRPPNQWPMIFPYRWSFWAFFLNLVSFGFGIDRVSVTWGALCLLIVLTPICGVVWKKGRHLSTGQWAAFVMVMAILADLSAISIGRAGVGAFYSKSLEYGEHGLPLILLSALNWSVFLKHSPRVRVVVMAALWFFCFAAFSNNWDFDIYRYASAGRAADVRCVRSFYNHTGNGNCPATYPVELSSVLEQAQRLNASFYQDAIQANRKTSSGPPAYLGAHDVADCHHIAGWAYDKSDPDVIVAVAIYDGDLLLSTVPATGFSAELLNAGIGTGAYVFEYETPPALKDGRPHSIRVQFAGTKLDLPNTPKVLACSPP